MSHNLKRVPIIQVLGYHGRPFKLAIGVTGKRTR